MARTTIVLAALLALTAQAHAGAGFGGAAFQASSTPVTSESDLESETLFSVLVERFQLVYAVTFGEPISTPDGSAYDRNQCTENEKSADAEDVKESESAKATNGPEPIYFAF
ncbi:MAG: hypothetical protein ACE5FO_01705 [Parvularculaceae bacterium]